jgi:hypothetical protein
MAKFRPTSVAGAGFHAHSDRRIRELPAAKSFET